MYKHTKIADKTKRVTVQQGSFIVSNTSIVLTTLLGSCVAACLYDPVNRIIGMNHFLLANQRYPKNEPLCVTEAGRYGVHAMELVINGMLQHGAERRHIRAKAFGGGSFNEPADKPDNFFCVGEVNSRFVLEFLRNDGIPLMAADLGGDRARIIHFSSDDFSVLVRRIKKQTELKVVEKEKVFWLKSIKDIRQKPSEPEIWG